MTISWISDSDTAASAETLIVGESSAIVELRHLIRQVAPSNASVIVTGPSGAGKEMVARAIHAESNRAARSYVGVNCGAIPRELLESELFGHEKGSFTGAVSQRRGRFEEAHGGTLFLDEIGDMPADMQVKLLRVLEERSIQRIGGSGQIAVDTRIISATHRDLEESIEQKSFREDLFYRLAVLPIELPSLAARAGDVPLLVRHFLRCMGDLGRVQFNQAAMDRLVAHNWPGNVRELRNVVQRAAILFAGQTVGADQVEMILGRRARIEAPAATPAAPQLRLVEPQSPPAAEPAAISLDNGPVDIRTIVADIEQRYINEALRLTDGVVAEAARLLSLQRTTLIEKMRKHGLAKAA